MSLEGAPSPPSPFVSSLVSLVASSSTLICCALPALLVSLGAGAVLASLVAVFPQIVWLSEHKEVIFLISSLLMVGGGVLQWRNRFAPCPVDPHLRNLCLKTRRTSLRIYIVSLFFLLVGGWFAFIQPLFM